ncbi:MAG TPA: SpoIIE family protein phosphatase [Ktedonosporobacter sp.]|nr:SpoIIE family protein phosphatase [Ktedonosporobacter sp.]
MNRAAPSKLTGRPPSFWRRLQHTLIRLGRRIRFIFVWVLRIVIVILTIVTFAFAQSPLTYLAFFLALILLSIAFALVRTRLVSFPLFISRSLVYSVLTITLAIVYFITVAVMQTAHFPTDPKANGIGTVIGTLITVALFNPLRIQLQKFIDKRFYRQNYDAAQVIAAFTSTLREEIDLNQLNAHLLAVVRETLFPSSISLWLRQPASEDDDQDTFQLAPWSPPEQGSSQTTSSPDVASATEPYVVEVNSDVLVTSKLEVSNVIEVSQLPLKSRLWSVLEEAGYQISLPLISRGELIGLLNLGPRLSGQGYTSQDRTLLSQLSAQVAPALRVAQLVHEQQEQVREHERIEQELRTARLIQHSFLPEALPLLAGWQLNTSYKPAREVGGDFYDFMPFEDGRLGLVLGDATDHGMPAALVMTTTCTMLRTAAQASASPAEVLARVNTLLYGRIPSRMFVTCFYAILDPKSGRLQYANAGQDWPFRYSQEGASELRATGMPLGMMPGTHYEGQEVTLAPGESILLYSDGLVEAHNTAHNMFGLPHLTELIAAYPGNTTLIDYLLGELKRFTGADWEQEDDVTLVTLQRVAETSLMNKQPEIPERLLDTSIPSIPGNEQLAMEQVAQAIEPLHLPSERLANLKTAVAEAVMNAMEHGNHYQPDKVVFLQVLASEDSIVVRIKDQGEGQPLPERVAAPDLEAKLAGLQNPRGWGLFLIENLVDALRMTSEDNHHVVELTLYRQQKNTGNQQ